MESVVVATEKDEPTFSSSVGVVVDRNCITSDGPDCETIAPSKRCSRCHTEFYCSVKCQKKAWKEHRPYCVPMEEMRRRLAGLSANGTAYKTEDLVAVNSECPICLANPMNKPEILNACRHAFCCRCLMEWQTRSASARFSHSKATTPCPLCRTEMGQDVELQLIEKARFLAARANRTKGVGTTVAANDDNDDDALEQRSKLRHEALVCIEKVMELEYPRIDVYFTKAEILVELERYEEAIETVDEMIREDKQRKDLLVLKLFDQAEQAQARGDVQEHERLQEAVVQEYERIGKIPSRLGQDYTECNLIKASAYQAQGKYSLAKDIYISIIQSDDNSGDPVPQRKCWMGLAECMYGLGEYEKCISASEAAVLMNRHFPGVHNYKALALKEQGKLAEAVTTMKRAVLYETPWDDENKADVWKLYVKLQSELQELKEEEGEAPAKSNSNPGLYVVFASSVLLLALLLSAQFFWAEKIHPVLARESDESDVAEGAEL